MERTADRSYDIAVWCRGEATRWGGDTVMPYAANVAVEVDGVLIAPGTTSVTLIGPARW